MTLSIDDIIEDQIPESRMERSRAGRKTDLERTQIRYETEQEAIRLEHVAHTERNRAVRLQPDTKHSLRLALVLAAVPLLTAGAVSYATTVAVAAWMKLPWPVLDYVVPGMLEALVVFSSLDYLIAESRKKGSGRGPFWAMIGFSAVNVLGNVAHTIVEWGPSFGGTNWQSFIGAGLSGSAAFVVVYLSKRLAALAFVEAGA